MKERRRTISMTNKALRANLLLLLTAAIWGFAFVAQRSAVQYMGSFSINAVRFALGGLVLLPFLISGGPPRVEREGSGADRGKIRAGVILTGVVLFGAVSLQQIGLESTSAGTAGFITGLYVVLVPILDTLRGDRPHRLQWIGVTAAAIGLYFLSVDESMHVQPGDVMVFAGALLWAVHVQLVGWLSRRMAPLHLALGQFALCAALSAGAAWLFEPSPFSGLVEAAVPILYAGVLSVGVAYSLQVLAQKDADPTPAAVIMSLEAVFAAVGGRFLLGEFLSPRGTAGAALMLAAMILAQWPEPRRSP